MNSRSSPGDAPRKADGSVGDADYASIGTVYRDYRVADAQIAAVVHAALGDARSVLNIGAGTGSYEPTDRRSQEYLEGALVLVTSLPEI
jgi:hypothetical protein